MFSSKCGVEPIYFILYASDVSFDDIITNKMDSKVLQEIAKNLTDASPLSEKKWEELLSISNFITLRGNKRLYSVTVVPNPKSSGTYGIEDIDFIDIFTTDKETLKIIKLELDLDNVAKFINPEFRERKKEMKLTP